MSLEVLFEDTSTDNYHVAVWNILVMTTITGTEAPDDFNYIMSFNNLSKDSIPPCSIIFTTKIKEVIIYSIYKKLSSS
jgi:hypothetical protein